MIKSKSMMDYSLSVLDGILSSVIAIDGAADTNCATDCAADCETDDETCDAYCVCDINACSDGVIETFSLSSVSTSVST